MAEPLEVVAGRMRVILDHRVIEVFGFDEGMRFHVADLETKVDGPDGDGGYMVQLGRKGGRKAAFSVPGSDMPALQDLLDRAVA